MTDRRWGWCMYEYSMDNTEPPSLNCMPVLLSVHFKSSCTNYYWCHTLHITNSVHTSCYSSDGPLTHSQTWNHVIKSIMESSCRVKLQWRVGQGQGQGQGQGPATGVCCSWPQWLLYWGQLQDRLRLQLWCWLLLAPKLLWWHHSSWLLPWVTLLLS